MPPSVEVDVASMGNQGRWRHDSTPTGVRQQQL